MTLALSIICASLVIALVIAIAFVRERTEERDEAEADRARLMDRLREHNQIIQDQRKILGDLRSGKSQ